jgi:hypothetical protein
MRSYGYFVTHHLQAGRDYVFTYGPLGYFWSFAYDADLFWYKYWYELVVKLIVVMVIMRFTGYFPGLLTKLLFCFILVILGRGWWIELEHLAIFLLGIIAVKEEKTSFRWWVPVSLFLAVLSLVKFTFFILAVVVLALVSLNILGNKGRRAALRPLALFAAGLSLVWLALGQSLGNLPRYLVASLRIAGGYDAMALQGDMDKVYLALLVLATLGVALVPFSARGLPAARRGLGSLRQLSRLGLLGAVVFMQWKHWFTRHGDHSAGFFSFMLLLPFLLPALFPAYDWAAPLRVRLATACFFLSFIGFTMSSEIKWIDSLSSLPDEVARNGETVLDPSGLRSKMEEQRATKQQEFALPLIKARVGDAPIDLVSYEQGVLFLNGMNWRPRPVFQSYSAYTPALLAANAQFFRSAAAPEYVLFKLETIDERLPALDDGPALLEILRRYRPLLVEKGYLLLERHRDPGEDNGQVSGEVVLEKRVRFGEEVDLRGLPGKYHTLALKIQHSWRGRLRKFFYQPPEVRIQVRTPSSEEPLSYRLIPSMAEVEFIFSPLLRGLDDFINLYDYDHTGGDAVTSFSITTSGPASYADEIAVTVKSYPRLVERGAVDPATLYQIKHPGVVTAGAVTSADAEAILGWAWDLRQSGDPVRVDVYADSQLLATVLADQFRQDVADARVGDGRHGFSLATPDSLKDGKAHVIQIKVSGTDDPLAEGVLLAPAPGHDKAGDNFAGSIDGVDDQHIHGWAWDSQRPNAPLNVDIYVDDTKLATVRADQFRSDLRDANVGDGKHGFDLPCPAALKDGKAHAVRVKVAGTGSTIVEKGALLPKNAGAAARQELPYAEVVKRIREAVRTKLPADATVLVVSTGDDDLLTFEGRTGQHFPQGKGGASDGNPADSKDAITRLEALRVQGSQYLLFPEPAFWWLDDKEGYKEFKEHLEKQYRVVVRREDTCVLFDLRR